MRWWWRHWTYWPGGWTHRASLPEQQFLDTTQAPPVTHASLAGRSVRRGGGGARIVSPG